MKLTHELVQPLIKTLEDALPYKVTITDVDGYIVGTSDPSRLDQFHPSAYEIICGRKPIETLEGDTYVNLPDGVVLGYGEKIEYGGECIGLIGLVGPPEERKKDIKTAQFMLRLLLEREQNRTERELMAADKNAFIVHLFHGASEQEKWLKMRAKTYGITLHLPRYVAVVRANIKNLSDKQPLELSKIRENVLQTVRQAFPAGEDLIYRSEAEEIIVLTASGGHKDAARRARVTEKVISRLFAEIQAQYDALTLIGVSQECGDYLDYNVGYQQALSAIEIGERTESRKGIYYYERMRLGRIVAGFTPEIRPILQESVIDKLAASGEPSLLTTLQVYFEQNMNVTETSNRLFIHRNTLQYRFKRIREITGYNIHHVDDMIQLRLAVMQYQYFQERPRDN